MKTKLHIGLLFGGLSTEHEVSINSARNIYQAIDKTKYEVSLIRIDKQGYWHLDASPAHLLGTAGPAGQTEREMANNVFLSPSEEAGQLLKIHRNTDSIELVHLPSGSPGNSLDVIFPILHGANGEDGTMQGLLKLVNLPYVGADVLGSAVGMDKDVMKRLLEAAGLPVPRFRVIRRTQRNDVTFDELAGALGLPFFIKPANAGSSVGISKVSSPDEYIQGLDDAFRFDHKVLIEENIRGRELECAVIGNEHPRASIIGEIVTQHSFYSYEAKYLDEDATTLIIPADIPDSISDHMRELSLQAYQVLCCEGMARVDMFLDEKDTVLINEINTIPGFTEHSMFPLLWEHTGLSFPDLIDTLVTLALERHERDEKLKKTR